MGDTVAKVVAAMRKVYEKAVPPTKPAERIKDDGKPSKSLGGAQSAGAIVDRKDQAKKLRNE